MITVRRAAALDAPAMAELLNEITDEDGKTARGRPVTANDIAQMMQSAPDRSAWHVAQNRDGALRGFQYIEPSGHLPPEACSIATFVKVGRTGLGTGSALFSATAQAARTLGYVWISAEISAENEGGLIYYQSRGFRVYGRRADVPLASGRRVEKILKRYDI
ncbi:GNAT family N-acetyltransferase [Pelagivirga sediminicola]|uniref:GNAT family N-acetyltransferase n=1 Tax=Pelagivirga sediminicola TaxID=2170575 RepID=A0A2T7G6A2_9RHOB|nr:GNAT family N-acetyltransferase [Pelagivirga sediminicola]PVA09969.1 GNAT family N-acetyltransferase [Pelagivirga sediminicola]